MKLPVQLLESLKGIKGFDEASFIEAHREPSLTSVRINPLKTQRLSFEGISTTPVPWGASGFYLDKRPSFTFDPLFHAGAYYVQEASSMFIEQAFTQLLDLHQPLKVLDLSAAPGGKSTHIQSLISADSLLVSNDVIRSRALVLKQNMVKWGSSNVIVTNNDPQHFQRLQGFFDVIVVDAPCSGSGLFRKDADAITEWSTDHVTLCQGRQKRILSDVLPALKPGGLLIYSTCSYSSEENEDVSNWLVTEQSMNSRSLTVPSDWGIVETKSANGSAGYRFFPDKVKGEGFYLSCFQNRSGENARRTRTQAVEKVTAKELPVVSKWIDAPGHILLKHGNSVIAFPENLAGAFAEIKNHLFIQYAGTLVGELIRDKLVPDHALAVSPYAAGNIPRNELSYDDAIRYLQRADIALSSAEKGWQLVSFTGIPLGWVNVLSGRINNYYPKELRILKQ